MPAHPHHEAAMRWLKTQDIPNSVLFCRATQTSFLRLLSTRAILQEYSIQPLSNREAWTSYERIISNPVIGFVDEPTGLETIWKNFTAQAKPSPKLWMDAYLAAFAIAGNYKFVTTDGGFRQFEGLNLSLIS